MICFTPHCEVPEDDDGILAIFVSSVQSSMAKIDIELDWEKHWGFLVQCSSHPCPKLTLEFTATGGRGQK
jgi:hypothetical protein